MAKEKQEVIFSLQEGSVKIINLDVKDKSITLQFSNGEVISISDYHSQDCCENVYADWAVIDLQKKQFLNKAIDLITLTGVKGEGFLITFELYEETVDKAFIACYNVQNGYYSSRLELSIVNDNVTKVIDISDLVEDKID